MLIYRSLERRQKHCGIEFVGPEDVNPGLVLNLFFVGHHNDAAAKGEHVVPQFPSKGPAFEPIGFDRIIPVIRLAQSVALQYVQPLEILIFPMLTEKFEMIQSRT